MNAFLTLANALSKVNREILLLQANEEDATLQELKLQALQEIKSYVMQFEWIKQERAKNRIKYYLIHQCSYKRTAEHFNVSVNAVQVAVNYASKKLGNVIGSNTIHLISETIDTVKLAKIMNTFYQNTNIEKVNQLICKEVIALLPEPDIQEQLTLNNCKRELNFLVTMSIMNLQEHIQVYDQEKMAHLMGILNSYEYSREKELISQLLKGDLRVKDGEILTIKEQIQYVLSLLYTD